MVVMLSLFSEIMNEDEKFYPICKQSEEIYSKLS